MREAIVGRTEGGQIKYLNEKEVAELTGIAVQTLRNYRSEGKGPPYVKIGKSVRYELEDILSFMEARKVFPVPA